MERLTGVRVTPEMLEAAEFRCAGDAVNHIRMAAPGEGL